MPLFILTLMDGSTDVGADKPGLPMGPEALTGTALVVWNLLGFLGIVQMGSYSVGVPENQCIGYLTNPGPIRIATYI